MALASTFTYVIDGAASAAEVVDPRGDFDAARDFGFVAYKRDGDDRNRVGQ